MNTNSKVIGWTQLGIKPKSTAQEADALTTWPMAQPQRPANGQASLQLFHTSLRWHIIFTMPCIASAAVKVGATQNAENVAQKVVKMFQISARKTALLKSYIKKNVKCHVSILVKHSKLGAKISIKFARKLFKMH